MSQAGQLSTGSIAPDVETLTGDAGGIVGPDGAFNIDTIGGLNIGTVGVPGSNSMTFNLDTSIQLPITNAAGSEGVYALGSSALPAGYVTDRFLHAFGTDNIFLGNQAGNLSLTGTKNIGIGKQSLNSVTVGSNNVMAGDGSGEFITTGSLNTGLGNLSLNLLTSASSNTMVGATSGSAITTSVGNTGVGSASCSNVTGSQNTALGTLSLTDLVTGSNNVSIGSGSGANYTGAESNNILISNDGILGESNICRIGTQGSGIKQVDTTFVAGIYQTAVGATNEVMFIDSTHKLGSSKGTDGQLIIGSTAGSPLWANLVSGDASITITNGANSIDIRSVGGGGGLTWNEVVGVSQAMAVNNGYIANNAGLVTLTLPAVAALGDVIRVSGKGAGGWRIAQNAGQTIYFGTSTTTTGVGGRLDSTATRDGLELVCVTANNDFNIISSIGNVTVT